MSDGSVGDAWSTTIVVGIIIGLVALGVALIVLTVWVVRATRVDDEALVTLEEMGTRRWRRAQDDERRRLLDEAGPEPDVSAGGGGW